MFFNSLSDVVVQETFYLRTKQNIVAICTPFVALVKNIFAMGRSLNWYFLQGSIFEVSAISLDVNTVNLVSKSSRVACFSFITVLNSMVTVSIFSGRLFQRF